MYLEGVRVLDFSRVLAGPLATQILSDLGAEVLKVESPAGDDTRRWGPPFQEQMSAYFQSANRGKRSLVLDLKTTEGRKVASDLVGVADLVVDNYLPKTRAKLGLCSESLRQNRPELITVSIVGYFGSRDNDPGYDLILQSEGGLLGITGPRDGEPHKVGVAVVDVLTGMMAANAALAALFRRERSGQGGALNVSLFQTSLFSLVNIASNHFVSGDPSARWGNDHPNLVPYGIFQTADRPIAIGVGNDPQFLRLLELLGLETADCSRLDSAGRVRQREDVVRTLQSALEKLSSAEVLTALKADAIPCSRVLRPDEALAFAPRWDPGSLVAIEHPEIGAVQTVSLPIRGDGVRKQFDPPPKLGEGGERLAQRWLNESSEK